MSHLSIDEISDLIRSVPDFPKPGVTFKDITPVLEDPKAFQSLAKHFADSIPAGTTKLLAIESRGFILGAAVAQHLDVGVVLVRKPGKLPRQTHRYSYDLEYGSDTLEIHQDAVSKDDKVTIIDDVLATGGTAHATETLCKQTGAEVLCSRFLMEIEVLNGGDKLSMPYHSFIKV